MQDHALDRIDPQRGRLHCGAIFAVGQALRQGNLRGGAGSAAGQVSCIFADGTGKATNVLFSGTLCTSLKNYGKID